MPMASVEATAFTSKRQFSCNTGRSAGSTPCSCSGSVETRICNKVSMGGI